MLFSGTTVLAVHNTGTYNKSSFKLGTYLRYQLLWLTSMPFCPVVCLTQSILEVDSLITGYFDGVLNQHSCRTNYEKNVHVHVCNVPLHFTCYYQYSSPSRDYCTSFSISIKQYAKDLENIGVVFFLMKI